MQAQEAAAKPEKPAAEEKAAKPEKTKSDRPKGSVPEDLLDDEHVQEEFGVSELTTPSIKKIFED